MKIPLSIKGPGPNGEGVRSALSYNAITNVWAAYSDSPAMPNRGAVIFHARTPRQIGLEEPLRRSWLVTEQRLILIR